jgi:hypothetical protein
MYSAITGEQLARLFRPGSVALVGASNKSAFSNLAYRNLVAHILAKQRLRSRYELVRVVSLEPDIVASTPAGSDGRQTPSPYRGRATSQQTAHHSRDNLGSPPNASDHLHGRARDARVSRAPAPIRSSKGADTACCAAPLGLMAPSTQPPMDGDAPECTIVEPRVRNARTHRRTAVRRAKQTHATVAPERDAERDYAFHGRCWHLRRVIIDLGGVVVGLVGRTPGILTVPMRVATSMVTTWPESRSLPRLLAVTARSSPTRCPLPLMHLVHDPGRTRTPGLRRHGFVFVDAGLRPAFATPDRQRPADRRASRLMARSAATWRSGGQGPHWSNW